MTKPFHRVLLAALLSALPLRAAAVSDALRADCEALLRGPHRLAGTEEGRRAADYLAERLRAIGVDEVILQDFPTAQTFTKVCEAETEDGRRIPLLPMRPDGVIPPVTPPGGIRGELVHAGRGTPEDFARVDPQGKIAVMDYNSEANWLRAFRLGAKAVIFVRTGPTQSRHPHYSRANANLPRFYFAGDPSELTEGLRVTLRSEVVWKRVSGRNVIAFIRGTEPVFDLGREEVVIVAAPLDTFGEVPERTPGARPAVNCGALLRLAEFLRRHRPRRHMMLVFFDAQARGHSGSSAFYAALETKDKRATVEKRTEAIENESDFLDQMARLAESAEPLGARATDAGRELVNRLKNHAADRAYEVRACLMDVREARAGEKKGSDAYGALLARERDLKPVQDHWNALRRELGRGATTGGTRDLFTNILDAAKAEIRLRGQELAAEREMLRSAAAIKKLLGDRWIALHISLLLGDGIERWGVIIGGDSEIHSAQDQPGLYGKVQRSFVRAYESLRRRGKAPRRFEVASVDGSLRQTRLLWSTPLLVHSGEPAGRQGIYNIVLGTLHEMLPFEGTPDDTLENVNLDRIERVTDEIALMLAAIGDLDARISDAEAVADQEGLSLRRAVAADVSYIVSGFGNGKPQGALVMGRQRGSSIPNKAVPGATVQVYTTEPWNRCFWHQNKGYALDNFQVVIKDQNGAYQVNSLPENAPEPVGFAAAFDERGEVRMASDMKSTTTVRNRLNLFRCRGGLAIVPAVFWPSETDVLTAEANAVISRAQSEKAYARTTDGVGYWYAEEKIEGIKLFGLRSLVALALPEQATPRQRERYGAGHPVGAEWLTIRHPEESAVDLWRLDEQRLSVLRDRDIMNSSLEEMHGRNEDLLAEARKTASPFAAEALATASFMGELPVYELTRTGMDDLVKAVLVLLALCVPFAFALERLLIGSTMIYRQVSWFALFFTLTFLVLYFSHPAFAIAKTPVVIFLGFAVVLLSAMVIFIIMQKFQVELRRLQGLTSSVHASDISRFSTIMAAMSMGISTMRRRPLRTALTAVTIILLTFTILCFASFDTQKGIVKLFAAPSPPYTGVFLHNPTWGSYNPDFLDTIRGRWADEAAFCPRYWVCPEFPDDPDFVIALEDGSEPVTLEGILGAPPLELRRRKDLLDLFRLSAPEDLDRYVLMTEAVAELLEVKTGDRVLLKGLPLEVGPILDAARLSAARDMDGSSILPVDFAAMKAAQKGDKPPTENLLVEQDTWTSLPIDSIVIVSAENARRIDGKPHVVHLYTDDSPSAVEIAEDVSRMMDKTPIVVTRKDGVYRHVLGTVVAASGVADLFFPVLLGGLVIFGTMLGSVADREKEIYTFSALGLAPPHVASLFFAEAMVYSVLGGLGGYLIAQASMKILGALAGFGLVQVPEMNYSSTNAIVTILIVMATVLVSALYPAVKASRSANPGLLRSWRLPAPRGDVFDLLFPFTVSEYDLTGVVSFLKEHFDNFSDTGLWSFIAQNARLIAHEDGSLGLAAHLALAPFDLGVTQLFDLRSAPSEIKGIDEVNIRLVRKSGQPKDWERLNKVLLDDLRTQFLLWRSLPHGTMELYRERTLTAMKGPPAPGAGVN